MQWDEFTTLRRALWIGGGQWAGKSTVAAILAEEYGLTHYHYDYHDARSHLDRRLARRIRSGEPPTEPDPEAIWIEATPAEMARKALANFVERFEWVQDDLRALVSPRPILADGWGLRPELVAPITGSTDRMVVLVPSEEFRLYQIDRLPRAGRVGSPVSDPQLAQRNRIERDRLIGEDAVRSAQRLNIPVIEVDGTRDARAVADLVAAQFAPFLPQRSVA
ncbi:hypothetical protein I0C86_17910 [Plantactinospora sp. S1510]|uniref:Uncharacterized protein n=1 Tax=Plantactinospora alkalitolerans TaxID=2789879 RepID=A0ABS0GX84_9ACTN|nr:hypothetical protein [Plantactinospora alkalitolerans]MBF9130821.1 hypothetical protein [Plantactinospora alkalitolerans]